MTYLRYETNFEYISIPVMKVYNMDILPVLEYNVVSSGVDEGETVGDTVGVFVVGTSVCDVVVVGDDAVDELSVETSVCVVVVVIGDAVVVVVVGTSVLVVKGQRVDVSTILIMHF